MLSPRSRVPLRNPNPSPRANKKDPVLLADPSLVFFRDYDHNLGADIPHAAKRSAGPKVPPRSLPCYDPSLSLLPIFFPSLDRDS